ncbi:OPT oligopeptide transporter protein-domain-containing protein [Mortierella sp. GBAus27b]|nr:OPT oligopeptide transporter protein-domain-containing protein [Mortierella sp. GBAus27b]
MNSANQGEDSRKHRTRSLISSALSGLFESVSHRHRSVDSNTEGTNECDKEVAMVIAPCQTTAYLELSHESNGMETNETLLGLGIGSGLGIDTTKFDSYSNHGPSTSQSGGGNAANTKEISPLEVRSASISSRCDRIPGMSEDSPVRVMTGLGSFSMIHSGGLPKALISDYNYKRRPSNLSLDARRVLNGPGRGNHGPIRSVRSVGSIDFVSQQIAARHHQHSQLAGQPSIVASLHARSQAIRSNCESISDRDSNASDGGDEGGELGASTVLENSPIQVVRATVGTVDDPSLPCFTFRMWVLSTVFVIMGAVISEYNFFRKHSVYFSIYFVQLASHFCGKAMARWLPTREFEIRIPDLRWMFRSLAGQSTDDNKTGDLSGLGVQGRNVPSIPNGVDNNQTYKDAGGFNKKPLSWRFTLNPGKFNMKEHMLIGIAAAAGCSPAYATNVIGIQSLVFDSPLDNLTGLGLVVSSQCIGFSMAWFLFDFVIKPSAMIWPSTLVNVSLYNTLHEHKVLTRWFTRMQLFWCAFFAIFLYQWLPRMFMPVLSSMALLCWIQPSNNILRKLGSGHTGLGIGCISLDWSIISGVGPLYTPWWAQCNFFFGLIAVLWVVTPVMYFSNYWSAMSYPIVSSNLYDNQAQLYEVSRILNRDLSFNATLYESYSRVAMTPYFAITYGTSFMAVIATFVHVALYYGADIWLITRTRCERKMRRIRQSGLMKSATGFFQPSNSGASVDEGASTLPAEVPLSGLDAPNPEFASNRPGHGPSSRRGSNTTQFRNDDIATCGRDSEDIGSPRYAQSTQQQSPFAMGEASARSRRGSKAAVVDDRDQIPTEKFGKEDIHTTLMRAYPEIPGWWFGVTFIICFAMAVVVCVNTEIQLPVGALLLALILAAVFAIPMAIIQALSSSQIGLNVLSEVVCGYLLPGNQLANSVFKCYSYMALYQCLNLTQGFKLGHYMKVPPRKIFIAVVYGTVVGAFVNVQVMEWVMLYNRAELFDHSPRNGWSFRNLDLFFSASLLWGAISPTRLFEEGSIYHFLPYCFLIGVILPIPFYVMHRYFPPYGSMCKGNSVFPFMPKCTCPASHIAASSADDGMSTISIFPSTFRGGPGVKDLIDPENNLEKGGRSSLSRVLEKCWSFRGSSDHCHRSTLESHAGLDATTERGVNPDGTSTRRGSTTCSPLAQEAYNKTRTAMGVSVDEDIKEGSIRSSNSVSSDDTSEPAALEEIPQDAGCHRPPRSNSPHTPHIYYGRSDSVWEHRLRRVPWHLINTPLICVGASFVPQAPASFVVSAGVVAFCFAFLVLRYNHEWWRRYTFVLAAALDAGTQICNMAIFVVFSLILRGVIKFPVWLGNDAVNVEQCGVGDGVN